MQPIQTDLPLEQAAEAITQDPNLTEWQPGPPPCIGWWPCKGSPEVSHDWPTPYRRYWNGELWSALVPVGFEDDARVQYYKHLALHPASNHILWCGLKKPHPDGYTPEQWSILDKLYPAN